MYLITCIRTILEKIVYKNKLTRFEFLICTQHSSLDHLRCSSDMRRPTAISIIYGIVLLGSIASGKSQGALTPCNYNNKNCVPAHLCDKDGFIVTNAGSLLIPYQPNKLCSSDEACCSHPSHGVNLELDWVVQIVELIYDGDSPAWLELGGGSLIAPDVVLTVAHILDNSTNADIEVLGEGKSNSRGIKDKHVHPNYKNGHYDAALLKLDKSFQQANLMGISLQPEPVNYKRCHLLRWGKRKLNETSPQTIQQIQMPIASKLMCQSKMRMHSFGESYVLGPSLLCAGGIDGQDASVGDGGYPLVCSLQSSENRYQLYGMVAFGLVHSGGLRDIPGVYVNVQSLVPWISQYL